MAISRLYPDGAYGRYLLQKPQLGPKQLRKNVCIQKHNLYVITVIYVMP